MNKKFYKIEGKIRINDGYFFSFKSFKSAISKLDIRTIFHESDNKITFSSYLTEILALLPIRKYPKIIKPGFFIATSYVSVRLVEIESFIFLEYILSLKRLLMLCILITLLSFIPVVIYRSILSFIWVPLGIVFTWCLMYPLTFLSMPDEFNEFLKSHITNKKAEN